MYCPKCGREVQPSWKFCDRCGEQLGLRSGLTTRQAENSQPRLLIEHPQGRTSKVAGTVLLGFLLVVVVAQLVGASGPGDYLFSAVGIPIVITWFVFAIVLDKPSQKRRIANLICGLSLVVLALLGGVLNYVSSNETDLDTSARIACRFALDASNEVDDLTRFRVAAKVASDSAIDSENQEIREAGLELADVAYKGDLQTLESRLRNLLSVCRVAGWSEHDPV